MRYGFFASKEGYATNLTAKTLHFSQKFVSFICEYPCQTNLLNTHISRRKNFRFEDDVRLDKTSPATRYSSDSDNAKLHY